jgi:hypothetical protein
MEVFMELNGLANIYAYISESKDKGELSQVDFELLEIEIFKFKDYLNYHQKNPDVKWHQFLEFIWTEGNDTTLDWTAQGINPDESQE